MVHGQISDEADIHNSLFITACDHVYPCGTKIYFYLLFLVSYFFFNLVHGGTEKKVIHESYCMCTPTGL